MQESHGQAVGFVQAVACALTAVRVVEVLLDIAEGAAIRFNHAYSNAISLAGEDSIEYDCIECTTQHQRVVEA